MSTATTQGALRLLRRAGRGLLDAVLPPRCLSCGLVVTEVRTLCPECWQGLTLLGDPQCDACGLPFPHSQPEGSLCGACLRRPSPWEKARAALAYDDASKGMILRFKHADYTEAAETLAGWMARAGDPLLRRAELLAPVPLHPRRLFDRRYNQSALLAQALGRRSNREVVPDLLLRRRNTPSQGHLSLAQRRRNVAGAFAVHPRHRAQLDGRHVLLIDDVYTTGATLGACTRALYRADARAVDVLTLARVVRPARD
ncbi:ComF family protein [Aquibaculum sediminis]|uniref:ComF family protein n=1 Tax=Aquibaculum sediminis TaxID=3231907 RepID=UPI0034569859